MSETQPPRPRVAEARRRYRQGECCAQAIVSSYLESTTTDTAILRDLSAGLCGGMGNRKADCGALLGAALCIGPLLRDSQGQADDKRVRDAAAALNREFTARYGGSRCEEVLKHKPLLSRRRPYCEEVTAQAAQLLESLLGPSGKV